MTTRVQLFAVLVATTALTAVLGADTLYLRNGTRIEGVLVSADMDSVQFEEDRGVGQRRVRDFSRDDVLRIELEPRRQPGRGGAPAGRPSGMRERLIPFAQGVIVSVDMADGTLKVDWGADF